VTLRDLIESEGEWTWGGLRGAKRCDQGSFRKERGQKVVNRTFAM
jgi:hypothetical protein